MQSSVHLLLLSFWASGIYDEEDHASSRHQNAPLAHHHDDALAVLDGQIPLQVHTAYPYV